jgi:hypothetical protein
MNPYRVTLLVLSIAAVIVGWFLIDAGNTASHGFFSEPGAGLGQTSAGGVLVQLGAMAFLLWLTAGAIAWTKPASTPASASSKP